MISEVNKGARLPVALYYSENTGFETAYDRVENTSIELRDDLAITRIDRNCGTPKDGSIGIGLVKVKEINQSSNSETKYLILELLDFKIHGIEETTEATSHDVRNHVDRSHRDKATIRATDGLNSTNITR